MSRNKVVIPMVNKKRLGSNAERSKGKHLNELQMTQIALEQLAGRLSKLERAHNANDKELKEARIQLNLNEITIKRLRDRVERSDGE